MKKVLLASSALVASAALAAPAAASEKVTWNAFTQFHAGSAYGEKGGMEADNAKSKPVGMSAFDFRTNAEVHLKFSDTADNGLNYGFKVELETDQDSTKNTDENHIFISGDWGQIQLGDQDGAADQLKKTGTTNFVFGMINNSTGANFDYAESKRKTSTVASITRDGDNTKVTYLSPSFSGFTVGASYSPEANDGGTFGESAKGTKKDHFEAGVGYSGDFDGVGLGFGLTMTRSSTDLDTVQKKVETKAASAGRSALYRVTAQGTNTGSDAVGTVRTTALAGTTAAGTTVLVHDATNPNLAEGTREINQRGIGDLTNTGYQLGATVSAMGFTLGLAGSQKKTGMVGVAKGNNPKYKNGSDASVLEGSEVVTYSDKVTTYTVGLSYGMGPWTVATGMTSSKYSSGLKVRNADQKLDAYSAGVSYNIAPGLTASLGGTMGKNKVSALAGHANSGVAKTKAATHKFSAAVASIAVSF